MKRTSAVMARAAPGLRDDLGVVLVARGVAGLHQRPHGEVFGLHQHQVSAAPARATLHWPALASVAKRLLEGDDVRSYLRNRTVVFRNRMQFCVLECVIIGISNSNRTYL